jgi:hypothetical protein
MNDPSQLTKHDSLLTKLARAACEDCSLPAGPLALARLLVLANALQDDAQVLAHLRSGGPHVRGCFSLDAIRGRS